MNSLLITIVNKPLLIYLHMVKWFQVFLTPIILFNTNHLFALSKVVTCIISRS